MPAWRARCIFNQEANWDSTGSTKLTFVPLPEVTCELLESLHKKAKPRSSKTRLSSPGFLGLDSEHIRAHASGLCELPCITLDAKTWRAIFPWSNCVQIGADVVEEFDNTPINLKVDVADTFMGVGAMCDDGSVIYDTVGYGNLKYMCEFVRVDGTLNTPKFVACEELGQLYTSSVRDPILEEVLKCIQREGAPINKLRGLESAIIRETMTYLPTRNKDVLEHGNVSVFKQAHVDSWPQPTAVNVNMMPFRLFDKASVPDYLLPYWDIIVKCSGPDSKGKVGYVTVHESFVKADTTQRRGGLHTETPGVLVGANVEPSAQYFYHHWGIGNFDGYSCEEERGPDGGIYMVSNVPHSTLFYDCEVKADRVGDVPGGQCEYLRRHMGDGLLSEKNAVYWINDRTPHEAMPVTEDTMRQYVRVVVGGISVWFRDHSTANDKCELPQDVRVMEGSKFEAVEVEESKRPTSK